MKETMSTKEIIDILENEQLTLKYKNIQNIPMGESIHFTFTAPKEEISKEMIKRFGRDFNRYEGNEALFFVTNGEKIKCMKFEQALLIIEVNTLKR